MLNGMSVENERPRELMLCATSVLKPPPVMIGHIAGEFSLPRAVALKDVIAGVSGAVAALIPATIVLGMTFRTVVLSMVLGGVAGFASVRYSPMRGESFFRYLGLQVGARRNRVQVNGKPARVWVGVCQVTEVAAGRVTLLRGAIDVADGSVNMDGTAADDTVPLAPASGTPDVREQLRARQRERIRRAGVVDVDQSLLPEPVVPMWANNRPRTTTATGAPTPVPDASRAAPSDRVRPAGLDQRSLDTHTAAAHAGGQRANWGPDTAQTENPAGGGGRGPIPGGPTLTSEPGARRRGGLDAL
jgi:hypothetical protein